MGPDNLPADGQSKTCPAAFLFIDPDKFLKNLVLVFLRNSSPIVLNCNFELSAFLFRGKSDVSPFIDISQSI